MKEKCCSCCGKTGKLRKMNGVYYCNRHAEQVLTYGYNLDESQHDETDPNEIIMFEDHAEIVLYDNITQEELEDRILIDLEDVDVVKNIIWKKQGKHLVGIGDRYIYDLPNLILDCNDKVEYINGNIFDNRKSNLDIIKKKKFKHHFANSKKYKNKILVTSLGGSSEGVTGSCFAVEYPLDNGNRDLILIEAGGIQTNRIQEDYIANKKVVEHIPFNLASNIFVCHIHIDHTFLLPAGITRGFSGNVITGFDNSVLLKPMLLDSSWIHARNVESLNSRGKNYETLYDEGDVYTLLSRIKPYSLGEIHKVNSNLSFRFVNNNHCVGSTMLELFIKKPSGRVVKIVYTSDVGSNYNQKYKPYSEDREIISKANLLICESTYGSKEKCFNKKDVDKEYNAFINKIKEVTSRGNRVLVPVFSFDRGQSFMTLLYQEFKDDKNHPKIVVDSRLFNNINSCYREILKGDKLELWNEVLNSDMFIFVDEFKKTEIYATDKSKPYVYLSSSGMVSAGHSTTYAKYLLPRKDDCICFVGYCGVGTNGNLIQNGAKSVTIDNVNVPVRCEVNTYRCFSGHATQKELIQIMKQTHCDMIAIHHGDENCKRDLKFDAEEEFLFSNMNKKVKIIDKKNNQIIL